MLVLDRVSSPIAKATELYQARPYLQDSLYCVEIVQEAMQLVELMSDGSRIEHWVKLGQAIQVFVNCDLMNPHELEACFNIKLDQNPRAMYAVPFGTCDYYEFHGNLDMLFNPRIDPDFERKQAVRKSSSSVQYETLAAGA
jgi:hypothetical protein